MQRITWQQLDNLACYRDSMRAWLDSTITGDLADYAREAVQRTQAQLDRLTLRYLEQPGCDLSDGDVAYFWSGQ